nr:putative reverse transcriptase domain-containing protein [Tanacetum cinerariifolium]
PPAAATWQHPIRQPRVTWHLRQHGHRRRSTTVNAAGHRSTAADHGGDRRSTTVDGGEPPLTAARPPLTTIGPSVNGGWWAGQRLEMGRSRSGLGRVRIGSGTSPPRGMPRHISVHNTFHVSNIKKCLSDESLVIPMKVFRLDDKLNFMKEPVEIMDREVKQLKRVLFL